MDTDNPPAFPTQHTSVQFSNGMTLRDWFAGQALAGSCDNVPAYASGTAPDFSNYAKQQATLAYAIADAMLEARKGTQP